MTTYLVTCECGKNLPVQVGQAGEQVSCACGKQVSVPPLRKLRHLPVAQEETVSQMGAAWDARKGVAAAAFIAAIVLIGIAGWSRINEPTVPEFPSEQEHAGAVNDRLDTIKPLEAWQMWIDLYRPLGERGFAPFRHQYADAIEKHVADKRFLQKVLLVLAAVAAGIGAVAWFWPRSTRQTVRQGDKEIRTR